MGGVSETQVAAMAAMDRGWPVFPVNGKEPATANGLHDATTDRGRIHTWWGPSSDSGIALSTGEPAGVWVLDLDGEEGKQAVLELQKEHGELPETTAARTGGRGFHLFFRMPEDRDVRNSVGKVAEGVDVRGTGGYVVLPPSRHPSGTRYEWVKGRSPNETPAAPAPDWLLDLVTASVSENGRPSPAEKLPDTIPAGQRNDTLASLAGSMRRRGASREAMRAALHAENMGRCDPPLPEDEVDEIAASIERYPPADDGRAEAVFLDNVDEDWGTPVPLGPELPDDLPTESLPSPLREHVESVARGKQVPAGLPLGVGLAAISTAVASKVEVEVRNDWTELVNSYVGVLLDPANRKSAVESEMAEPLREWERSQAEEHGPDERKALDKKDALEKRLDRAKRQVSKADTQAEEGDALEQLKSTRDRLEELEIPHPERLLTNDVTPEALGRLMDQQHGRASIISSEGDVLRIFAGKYSSGDPTLDIIKKAHTGDPVRVDRVGREGVHLPTPVLTVGLTLQWALLRSLSNRDVLDGEGVLARFLWIAPPSRIGERLTGSDVPDQDPEARDAYAEMLTTLLKAEPAGEKGDGSWNPHTLRLAPEAREVVFGFEEWVEARLAGGGDLAPIRAWGGKLVGNTVRIAALLHAAKRAGWGEEPFAGPIHGDTARSAVRLGEAMVPHARHVLAGELEADSGLERARYLLRRIRELTPDEGEPPSRSELLQAVKQKKGLKTRDELEETLDRLRAHNLVKVVDRPSEGRGRNPAPLVVLHPEHRKSHPRNPRKGPQGGERPDSLDFLDKDSGAESETEEARI